MSKLLKNPFDLINHKGEDLFFLVKVGEKGILPITDSLDQGLVFIGHYYGLDKVKDHVSALELFTSVTIKKSDPSSELVLNEIVPCQASIDESIDFVYLAFRASGFSVTRIPICAAVLHAAIKSNYYYYPKILRTFNLISGNA